MIRVFLLKLSLLLALALLAGFAWLTAHPDNPWLEQAEGWPVVGGLAESFRRAYLPPERSDAPAEGGGVEVEYVLVGPDGRPIGQDGPVRVDSDEQRALERLATGEAPSSGTAGTPGREERVAEAAHAPTPSRPVQRDATASPAPPGRSSRPLVMPTYQVSHWSWFRPGHPVRESPAAGAPAQDVLDSLAWLPVLDRREPWVEVVFRGRRGWIDTSWQPQHSRRKARRGLLRHRHEPVQGSDWWRIREARKILGIDTSEIRVGAYELLTDVEDPDLFDLLGSAAVAAEESYFVRYGRLPSGDPLRSVILFAREADYRRFAESVDVPGQADVHVGHAGAGLLAFYLEGRDRNELVATLVHEICHLLNNRALAWRLPPWLEEGLATDLGSVWMESSPAVASARRSLEVQSPESRLMLLDDIRQTGKLPSSQTLMYADQEAFYENGKRMSYTYAHSFALVRYLLDGGDGRHADGFREFLGRIAAGRGADPKLLFKLLEIEPEELDRGFEAWLGAEAATIRRRLEVRAEAHAALRSR